MNFNATLIAQIVTFGVLVWFMQRFLWDPVSNMMAERKKRIAEGLAAAERGKQDQELARKRVTESLKDAKLDAAAIVGQAQKRAAEIVDEGKQNARAEGERILVAARAEIDQESNRAREQLRERVAQLALLGAERIIKKEIDAAAHKDILDAVSKQI